MASDPGDNDLGEGDPSDHEQHLSDNDSPDSDDGQNASFAEEGQISSSDEEQVASSVRVCPKCGKDISKLKQQALHIARCKGLIICPKCGKDISQSTRQAQHIASCKGKRPSKDNKSNDGKSNDNKSKDSKSEIKAPFQHLRDKNEAICEYCGNDISKLTHPGTHRGSCRAKLVATDKKAKGEKTICPHCKRDCTKYMDPKRHIRSCARRHGVRPAGNNNHTA